MTLVLIYCVLTVPSADTITYFLTALGVVRAGCTAFLVSTRNAAAGLADMFQRTDTTHLIASQDGVLRGVIKDALSHLPEGHVAVHDAPVFEDLFPVNGKPTNSAFEAEVDLPETYDMTLEERTLYGYSGAFSLRASIVYLLLCMYVYLPPGSDVCSEEGGRK